VVARARFQFLYRRVASLLEIDGRLNMNIKCHYP
jgi:hypothetical protein